ncbi:hypothetical protein ACWEP8_36665 [Streptomyces hydrogenans]
MLEQDVSLAGVVHRPWRGGVARLLKLPLLGEVVKMIEINSDTDYIERNWNNSVNIKKLENQFGN